MFFQVGLEIELTPSAAAIAAEQGGMGAGAVEEGIAAFTGERQASAEKQGSGIQGAGEQHVPEVAQRRNAADARTT